MDELTPKQQQIVAMVEACLERGFKPPLTWCAVGPDGGMFAARLVPAAGTEDLEMSVLFRDFPQGGLLLPAQVLTTDASGQGVRGVLQPAAWHFADRN